jgi:hypothetical protein
MSPLAKAIYELLRRRAPEPDPRITYAQLAAELRDLSEDFDHVYHRSRELFAALNEVGQECRCLKLPPLPALVVRADTGQPGAAYYRGKCSDLVSRGNPIAAWREDLEAVQGTTYPAR